MLFNSLQFAIFFAFVLLLHRSLPERTRNGVLLGASLVFYGMWVPAYLLLLLGEIAVNYALLRTIARGGPARRVAHKARRRVVSKPLKSRLGTSSFVSASQAITYSNTCGQYQS